MVVDPAGNPIAGAAVTAGRSLRGDSLHAAVVFNRDELRTTTSGPDGRFEIPDAAEDSIVIAGLGDRRSAPLAAGTDVKLVLAATSRLEGRVDLAGQAPANVWIIVRELAQQVSFRYAVVAPVAADGSFVIEGVPRGEVRVFAAIAGLHDQVLGGSKILVRGPVVRGIALSHAKSSRVIHAIVRNTVNTKLANAQVVVLPGRVVSTNLLAINQDFRGGSMRFARQLEGEHAPKQVVAVARSGDLFATIPEVPEGVASVCAIGLPEMSDEEVGRKLMKHFDKVQVICAPIPEHGDVVTLDVPPFPRLD